MQGIVKLQSYTKDKELKTTFDGRQPLIEDNLWWNNLDWKPPLSESQSLMKGDHL